MADACEVDEHELCEDCVPETHGALARHVLEVRGTLVFHDAREAYGALELHVVLAVRNVLEVCGVLMAHDVPEVHDALVVQDAP